MPDLAVAALRPPEPPLSDARVVLRPWEAADAEALTAACQDPEIARWVPLPWPYELADAQSFIERSGAAWAAGTGAAFAIVGSEAGALLGAATLHLDQPRRGIVGYWVAREARRRGVATSATRLLSRWGIETLGLVRVSLFTYLGNTASQRVAERAGFTREGRLRAWTDYHGEPRDVEMFSLLPADLGVRGG